MVGVSSYATRFRDYIAVSLDQDLIAVQAAEQGLSDEVRTQAVHTLEYGLNAPELWQRTAALIVALAPLMERAGQRKTWVHLLEQALLQSEQVHDVLTSARIRYHLGVLCQRQAQLEVAQDHLETSVAGFPTSTPPEERARALSTLGDILRRRRDFEEAAQWVRSALLLAQHYPRELAYGHIVLGAIAYDRRDWATALHAFDHAQRLAGHDYPRERAWALSNTGAVYQRLAQFPDALDCFTRAIPLLEQIQDVVYLGVTYMNLGNVYLSMQNPAAALRWYDRAESHFYSTQAWRPLASIALNQGMAHHQLHQTVQAEGAYLKSLELWQALGNPYQEANVLDGLGGVYASDGQSEKAKDCFRKGLDLVGTNASYDHLRQSLTEHLQQLGR